MYDKLTKSDIEKMQKEVEHRKLVIRKEAIEAVKEAGAQGDLSENFEYYAAKREKNMNESRIRYLEKMIKTAEIVSDASNKGEVGLNNKIQLYFEEDDITEEYKLVTNIRASSLNNLISLESPLGNAIMGRKIGDRVFIKVSDDYGYYVVIKAIDDSTDDSMDEIRRY